MNLAFIYNLNKVLKQFMKKIKIKNETRLCKNIVKVDRNFLFSFTLTMKFSICIYYKIIFLNIQFMVSKAINMRTIDMKTCVIPT